LARAALALVTSMFQPHIGHDMTHQLTDSFGREIIYLRLSVTDRCDLRCTYCMAENMTFLPRKDLLTLEELDALCSSFIARGIRKIRLTGGEPLVRRGLMSFLQRLSRHRDSGALNEITLTTNGTQLAKFAGDLKANDSLTEQFTLIDTPLKTGGPARYVKVAETGGILGMITPLTNNFCAGCNRLRVTCTGQIYTCLGHGGKLDLREAIRGENPQDDLDNLLNLAMHQKPEKHHFDISDRGAAPAVARHMSVTGG